MLIGLSSFDVGSQGLAEDRKGRKGRRKKKGHMLNEDDPEIQIQPKWVHALCLKGKLSYSAEVGVGSFKQINNLLKRNHLLSLWTYISRPLKLLGLDLACIPKTSQIRLVRLSVLLFLTEIIFIYSEFYVD